MKKSYHSLNKIYADPHVVALHNRINFIQKRRNKPIVEISTLQKTDRNKSNPHYQSHYKNKTLPTEQDPFRQSNKKQPQENASSRSILKQLKTARYRECKENSERMMTTIRQNRQKEINLKRIKRSKVLISQQMGRAKLEQFQKQKIRQIKFRNTREWADQQLQLKKLQLKKQLLLQQDIFLNDFEQQLARKCVLMKKIENLLHVQNHNI